MKENVKNAMLVVRNASRQMILLHVQHALLITNIEAVLKNYA